MERQKPRAGQVIDGFTRRRTTPRAHYYLDSLSRPRTIYQPDPNQTLPAPQPPPVSYPSMPSPQTNPELPTQALSELPSPQTAAPELNQGPAALPGAASLLGTSIPTQGFTRPERKRKRRGLRVKRFLKPALITLAVAVVGFGIWFSSSLVGSINKVFHGNVFSDAHALISGSTLKESNGRINILLAGDSADDPNHQGATLTDSIMVVSVDPKTKTGILLSIPRDLWVNIPSMGYQKINAANDVTSFHAPGLPSGGMGQLQQIVQNDLGIPIDYEALIDYTAFRDAVNTVGGITIDIQSPDPRGIYDAYTHLKLPNGEVTLDGQEALDLARARGDDVSGDVSYGLPNSDFSRTQHQRQMLAALFKKATSIGVLSNPLKITSLFNAFGNNIQTDLSLGDAITLMRLTNGLNTSKLQSVTYSYSGPNALLTDYTDPSTGAEALIPSLGMNNYSALRAYYNQLTSSNPIAQEAPTVTLLNGSDVSGLATREAKILEAQGFNVEAVADAVNDYPSTMIVNTTGGKDPAASAQLEKDIKGQVVSSATGSAEAQEATNYSTSYVVIMGQDWDSTTATGTPVQN